jgi:hypothetical protein
MKKEKPQTNLILETLSFFNQKIDFIIGKSEVLNELLEEIDDPKILTHIHKKIENLEKELDYIGTKINLEQKLLKKT